MFKNQLDLWWVLVIVGIVSTVFHLDPSSKSAYWTDVAIANISILVFYLHYHKSIHSSTLVFFGAASFIASLFFYFYSGDDRQAGRYVVMHSLWHVLTAISCYLLVKSTIRQKRIQGGFKPPESLFESLLSFGD
jgi:hypothetical protein